MEEILCMVFHNIMGFAAYYPKHISVYFFGMNPLYFEKLLE